MNNNPIYEQLIAQKLEQAPVPDMADAIWARITIQLDEDSTGDDNNNTPPSDPKTPATLLLKQISWVVLFAITIMIITRNWNRVKNNPAPQPVVLPVQTAPSVPGPQDKKALPVIQQQSRSGSSTTSPGSIDSVHPQPFTRLPGAVTISNLDSLQKTTPGVKSPFLTPRLTIDSLLPPTHKGVKGIVDDDYRIVPDTATKNHKGG